MKMKKTIAGVLASVVAVSAMATSMVSATTVKQEAKDTTWDLKGNAKWQATWATKLDGKSVANLAAQNDQNATLSLVFSNGDSSSPVAFDKNDVEFTDVKLTVVGQSSANSSMNETQTVELKNSDNAKFTFAAPIYGTKVAAVNSDGINISKYLLDNAADELSITLTYTMKDKTVFGTKVKGEDGVSKFINSAKNKDSTTDVIITGTATTFGTAGTANAAATNIAADLSNTGLAWKSAKAVIANDASKGVKLDADFFKTTTSTLKNTASFDDVKTNLAYAMKTTLGGTKGAKVTLTFAAPDDDSDNSIDGPSFNFADTVKEVGIMVNRYGKLQTAATVDSSNSAITFDWDTVIKNSGLTINSMGLVWALELGLSQKAVDANLVLESVKVSVPAKEFDDLSAGEPTTDAASAITTAATTAATEATAPATNPGTGNAPIALAVIPVAIVAAAIIAKKRG